MFKGREVSYYLEIVSCVEFKLQKCILLGEVSRKQSLLITFFLLYLLILAQSDST